MDTLRPHGLNPEPSDPLTRRLHTVLPHSWQRGFRDYGGFKALCDGAVSISALALPQYSLRFLKLGAAQKSYSYGQGSEQNVLIIDLNSLDERDTTSDSSTTNNSLTDDVLVFVHGGAWGSGKPWMYRLAAEGLARRMRTRYIVLVQYPVFPASTILEQRDCVCNALRFIRNGTWLPVASEKKMKMGRIFLSGHSSGANICALALIQASKAGRKVADIFISLAGVFDIERHYEFERSRGVHLISPMGAAAGSDPGRFWESSPTLLLSKMPRDLGLEQFFPRTLLVHGTEDTTVPFTSSHDLAAELAKHGVTTVTSYPRIAHVHPILELMQDAYGRKSSPCSDALILWYQRLFNVEKEQTFSSKL
jgi:acetyl esterase/lipase